MIKIFGDLQQSDELACLDSVGLAGVSMYAPQALRKADRLEFITTLSCLPACPIGPLSLGALLRCLP
jgi:hypothetical protein